MNHIIALHGEQGAGKDTVADILVEQYGFIKIPFADRLREICWAANPIITFEADKGTLHQIAVGEHPTLRPVRLQEIVGEYGWTEAKRRYSEVRRVQQVMGTDVFRDLVSNDYWVNWVADQITAHPGNYVIPDLRFPNEYSWLYEAGGSLWWIKRETNPHVQANTHPSEAWHPSEDQPYMILHNSGSLVDLANEVMAYVANELRISRATISEPEELAS